MTKLESTDLTPGLTNHEMPAPPRRLGWAVAAMVILLIPIGFAANLLIHVPAGGQAGSFLENEEVILTVTSRRTGTDHHFVYHVYSLRTGQTHEFTSTLHAEIHHNKVTWVELERGQTWHVKQFDADTFEEVSLGKVVLSEGQFPRDVHATGLIAGLDQKSNLFVSDPSTGTTRQLELPSLASNHFRAVTWPDPSPHLIVAEHIRPAGKPSTFRWYTWMGDSIELKSEWSSLTWPYISGTDMLRPRDNHDLEILSLADGAIVDTQSLRDRFKLQPGAPLTLLAVESPVAVFQLTPTSPKNFIVYDYRQQRILGELDGIRNVVPDIRPGSLVFEGHSLPRTNQLFSWEGKLLSSIPLDDRMSASLRTADGKRLMSLFHDESIHEVDLATGKILRTWRSKDWVLPTLLGVILAFCVWYGCWLGLSHRLHWHALIDVVVWNGLIAAGILYRTWLWGPSDMSGIVFDCLALSLSWLQFAAVWLVFGSMRWSLRALAPVLASTAAVASLLIVFRDQPSTIPLVFAVAAIGMLMLAGVLCVPYRLGWRLAKEESQQGSNELRQATGQMPLRDLFVLVGALALFLAVIRFVPFQVRLMNDFAMIVTYVVAGLGSASVGVWAALTRRHWTLRLAVFLCAVVAFSCLPGLYDSRFWSWKNWWIFMRFPTATAIFVAGSLVSFRLRGWRWLRTAK